MLNIFTLGSIPESTIRLAVLMVIAAVIISTMLAVYLRLQGRTSLRTLPLTVCGTLLAFISLFPLTAAFINGTSTEPSEYSTAHALQQMIEAGPHWTGQQTMSFTAITALLGAALILLGYLLDYRRTHPRNTP